jgi:predicted nuclease of predicted toxin-antitoxin system
LDVLLDQGLPRDAADQLRLAGVSCTHVGEIGMALAMDMEILDWARLRSAVIATLDADFHTVMAVKRMVSPSVVRIRVQGLKGADIASLLREILNRYSEELKAGCMITVKKHKTTCRLLG